MFLIHLKEPTHETTLVVLYVFEKDQLVQSNILICLSVCSVNWINILNVLIQSDSDL